MATNFETIWEALRARLEAETSSFKSVVRFERLWAPEELPAIEVWDNGDETPESPEGLPPLWRASGSLFVIGQPIESLDSQEAAFSNLNALIHEVKGALERKATDLGAFGAFRPGHVSYWTSLGIEGVSLSVGRITKGSTGQKTGLAIAEIAIEIATQ